MIGSDFDDFRQRYDDLHVNYWSNWLSVDELRCWYQERLHAIVAHVQQNSPFYRERLRDVVASSLTLENLRDLPFTTGDDLRDAMHDILCGKLSDASNAQLAEAWRQVIECHFPDEAPIVGILGSTEIHSFGDTLGDICWRLGVCNAKIWPHSPVIGLPKCMQLIRDLRPGILAASPGMFLSLAKAAERLGYDPVRDFAVRVLMMSGELCTPALRNNIRSLWGAEPYDSLYGSPETLVIAATDRRNRLVPHRLNYLFEVLDPATGASKGEQGDGELCVTLLIDGVKPLIRYRTGDLVSIQPTGSATLADAFTISVMGRVRDRIVLNDRALTTGEIEQAVLDGVTLCLGYRLVISRTAGHDSLTIRLEMSRRSTASPHDLIAGIRDRVRERLDCEAAVMLGEDADRPIDLGGWFSWKEARIVDHRSLTADARLIPAQ
jgi:phenylacetate-CoA ligase